MFQRSQDQIDAKADIDPEINDNAFLIIVEINARRAIRRGPLILLDGRLRPTAKGREVTE